MGLLSIATSVDKIIINRVECVISITLSISIHYTCDVSLMHTAKSVIL